jgi:tRNA dimethylallyltransferase
VGPTAVGKTAVAIALAQVGARHAVPLHITVISADARQVYRGLDIGTAKPDRATRARVPHLGLDLVEPGERYSAGRYARDAAGWLHDVRVAGRLPFVVGGTGFYVRAVADGLFREPPLDAGRRDRLRAWTDRAPGPALARWASRLDPRFSGGGRQRAARAVEVALLTGRALSWWQHEAKETGVIRPWYIHLTLPREVLQRRILQRVETMLAAGFVDEVRSVLARGVSPDAPGLDGVGYREVVAMLQGRLEQSRLGEAIAIATRAYAKRQETWFRHQLRGERGAGSGKNVDVWTMDATESPEVLAAQILERWARVTAPRSPLSAPR